MRLTFPTGFGINLFHSATVPESHVQMQRLMYMTWKEIRQGWGRDEDAQIRDTAVVRTEPWARGREKKTGVFDI